MTPPNARILPLGAGSARLLAFAVLFHLASFASAAAPDAKRVAFDIPSATARDSFKQFAAQSGTQVLYAIEVVEAVKTNAVKGEYSPREAIDRMLAGTTLAAQQTESGAIAVRRSADSEKNVPRAAQVATSDRPKNNSADRNGTPGEVAIELSPFVVSSDQDVGYLAGNTLSGSRLNTPLRDTAASLSVLTQEFLSDIGATSLTDAMAWTNNAQEEIGDTDPNDNGNFSFPTTRFRVRGVRSGVTRNYFNWNTHVDTYNVERIEEQRGPNSILFGIGSAGGLINTSTKRASTTRSFRNVQATFSSYGGYRGTLDINQAAINGKLGVRLNTVYGHAGSYRHHAFLDNRRIDLAVTYQLAPRTQLRAEFETGDVRQNVARNVPLIDRITFWLAAGSPTFATPPATNRALGVLNYGAPARVTYFGATGQLFNVARQARAHGISGGANTPLQDERLGDRSVNTGGPGQLRLGYDRAISVVLDQRLGEKTYLELSYNHVESHTRTTNAFVGVIDAGALSADPNQFLPNGQPNPNVGRKMFEGAWARWAGDPRMDNVRLSASTELNLGKWGQYRLAALVEHESRVDRGGGKSEVWADRPFNAIPENNANRVYRRSYVNDGDWVNYHIPGPTPIVNMVDPVSGRTLTSTWINLAANTRDDPSYQDSMLFAGQARYFKNRLALSAGLRKDWLDVHDRNTRRNPDTQIWEVNYGSAFDFSYTGRTTTLGAVGHVSKNISVFYNQSDNFDLPNIAHRVLPDGRSPSGPEGKGQDVGLALELLGGQFYVRAARFASGIKGVSTFGDGSGNQPNVQNLTNSIADTLIANNLLAPAAADARRVTQTAFLTDEDSEGYEVSLTGNLTKHWRLLVNYSYTDSFRANVGPEFTAWRSANLAWLQSLPQGLVTASGATIGELITDFESDYNETVVEGAGRTALGTRHHKVNLFTRYTFSGGRLNGLFLGGGYRHQSKLITGYANDRPVHGNSFWSANLAIGYRLTQVPILRRVNLQLNVANLFDDRKPLITRRDDDGSIARWTVIAPRSWRFTASTSF